MPLITIAPISIPNWQRDSDVELRIYSDSSFISSDGTLIERGDPSADQSKSDNFFVRVPCSVNGGVLSVPQCQLYSTVDSDKPDAHWQAWLYTTEGQQLAPFVEFERFMLPAAPTNTTWNTIAQAQHQAGL